MDRLRGIAKKLEVPGEQSLYKNVDILPLPQSRRTWTRMTFFWFWLSTSVNISTITGSGAILSLGLTVWQAVLADVITACFITTAIVANGHQGGQWGVPFVVANRSAWGVRGSWFVACNRLILSFCWFGVQSWFGGQCVVTLIGSMRPSFYMMKNHFSVSAHMDTKDFIGFIVYWLISLPILAIKPERYRIPAVISSICVTTGVIALLIWMLAREGGGGPLIYETTKTIGVPRLEGAPLVWAMIKSITAGIGGWAGACLYSSDFARYARRPGDQVYGQIAIIPACLILSSVIGLVITSCAAGIYPYQEHGLLWRPYKLMQVMQTEDNTAGMRAAIFFLSLVFILSQLCVNTAGNAITGSIDLQSIFPKWVNDRRGPFIVAVVGFAMQPWQLLNSATTFISVVSSYSIFLGPLTGIMITDYFIVRKQKLKLSSFYTPDETSIYWYWHGVNPRAIVCWVLAIFPSMPGFLASVSKGKIVVSLGWKHTSWLAWILGFAIASTLWVASNKIWPPPGIGEVDEYDFRDQPSVDESADEEKRVSAEEVDKVQEPALRY